MILLWIFQKNGSLKTQKEITEEFIKQTVKDAGYNVSEIDWQK